MPGHPGERQPGNNPQFPRYKKVEFAPYQGGKSNFPTWDVFTVFSSFPETYSLLSIKASRPTGARGEVRRAILGTVAQWKEGKPTPHAEAAKILVQDFLSSGVRHVEWTPVVDTLLGEQQELGEVNELTAFTYHLFSNTNWRPIVQGAETLVDADTTLQNWIEEHCRTWADSPDARKYEGSVGKFANKVLAIYFDAVDWQSVTEKFKG